MDDHDVLDFGALGCPKLIAVQPCGAMIKRLHLFLAADAAQARVLHAIVECSRPNPHRLSGPAFRLWQQETLAVAAIDSLEDAPRRYLIQKLDEYWRAIRNGETPAALDEWLGGFFRANEIVPLEVWMAAKAMWPNLNVQGKRTKPEDGDLFGAGPPPNWFKNL